MPTSVRGRRAHLEAELYLLRPGARELVMEEGTARILERRAVKVEGQSARISFELPPRILCRLRVERRG